MDMTHPLALHFNRSVLLLLLSSCQLHVPPTMRLCNSQIPKECLVCYRTSQCNWVIIKMLYRYLRRCLLGLHRSSLGFFTLSIRDVSLGPLGIYLRLYFYSPHDMCFAWSILYDMSLCFLVCHNHPCCTHIFIGTHINREFIRILYVLHLYLLS